MLGDRTEDAVEVTACSHCIVFLNVTAEEIGLFGSRYYTENPIFPIENTVSALNMDMIGRVDDRHEENPDYIYVIGSDRISTELSAFQFC